MEYMVFKETDPKTERVRCVVRDRKGRKFGDFGSWDAATERAKALEEQLKQFNRDYRWLGI